MGVMKGPTSILEICYLILLRTLWPLKCYSYLFRKYGDNVYFSAKGQHYFFTQDPKAIEQILVSKSKSFIKGIALERFRPFIGNGLLTADKELWTHERKIANQYFNPNNAKKIQAALADKLETFPKPKDNEVVDLSEHFSLWTLHAITSGLFRPFNQDELLLVKNAVTGVQNMLSFPVQLILNIFFALFGGKNKFKLSLKIEPFLKFLFHRNALAHLKSLHHLIDQMTQQMENNSEDNIIQAWKNQHSKEVYKKHHVALEEMLRNEIITLLFAGHDTTASTMSWALLEIIKSSNAQVKKKIIKEVDTVVSGVVPTFDELSKLTYLNAAVNETMRMYPSFWRIARIADQQVDIHNITLPESTHVLISTYWVHRNSKYWVSPEKFMPERFLGSPNIEKGSYIPFGLGPRMCIGSSLAQVELTTVLAYLFKNYDLEKSEPTKVKTRFSISMTPNDGCKVRLKTRKS
jgi:cytochrome P450